MYHRSEALFSRSQAVVPGGVHSPVRAFRGVGGVPRFMQSAHGVELQDVDGNRYVDYCMGWGPFIFGHQDPAVKQAVVHALDSGWAYGTVEPYSLELAELITHHIPWVEKVRFVHSGTEAVMSALRVARAVTGRQKILKFEGCYHGHSDSVLVKAGVMDLGAPECAGVPPAVAAETLVVPLNSITSVEKVFQRYGHEIAAVIIEPLPANYGLLIQEKTFLKQLVQIARDAGSAIIFDEVITGFRVALGGMAEKLGIRPDLVTYGKILGGGFPLGAYGGRADWMDWVAPQGPVYQAGTLSAHPIAVIAGTVTLKRLVEEVPYRELANQMVCFGQELETIARQWRVPLKVQSLGSLYWMVFGGGETLVRSVADIPTHHCEIYSHVFHSLLKQGIYLAPSAFEVSFLSTAHQKKHFEQFQVAFEKALYERDAH